MLVFQKILRTYQMNDHQSIVSPYLVMFHSEFEKPGCHGLWDVHSFYIAFTKLFSIIRLSSS